MLPGKVHRLIHQLRHENFHAERSLADTPNFTVRISENGLKDARSRTFIYR